MSLRDYLNQRPQLAASIAGGLVLVAVVALLLTLRGNGGGDVRNAQAFFTVDDGATYFADDVGKLPPFDHGGKPAVRAFVYDAGGTRFVNHLERLTEAGKRDAAAKSPTATARPSGRSSPTREVKRPGPGAWVAQSDYAKSAAIMSVTLPAGTTGEAIPVEP